MLQINFLRDNKQEVIEKLKVKNFDASSIIDEVITLDDNRKSIQQESDELLSRANSIAKEIGVLFKEGKGTETNDLKEESAQIKEKTKSLQSTLSDTENQIWEKLVQIPNVPHSSVPNGKSDADNETIKEVGEIPQLPDNKKPHWDLCSQYKLIDFELGNKITGAGFPVYTNKGAKLQRSLISYFLDKNIDDGYEEFQPPYMVNEDSAFGTGQLPDKEGQMYHVTADNLYLIPTAEVPVTNFFRDEIINKEDFPIKCTAYTPCFRREAGSYGKDVRGLNRLHQFDKIEIVQVQHPKDSYETLDVMVNHVSSILEELELPYRILRLCGGDLSFTASLTYDFEVYSAGQDRWLEVSSVSNFESYQSNRLKLRYKDENGKTQLCHTLNGSALALPRIFAALVENNQTDNGIKIPKALQEYTRFDIIE
ncbi:MAG: serine--tRNA ligase [Flavobacteriales bacterium]|nr:serine--tRNA ligase [Flavobacteriales bacterium]